MKSASRRRHKIWISSGKLPVEPLETASGSERLPGDGDAKSGSPVALLSQGDVTGWRWEDIISPIFSSRLRITASACGTLFFYPPPPPPLPLPSSQGQFSFMTLLALFSFPEASVVAILASPAFEFPLSRASNPEPHLISSAIMADLRLSVWWWGGLNAGHFQP